MIPIHFTDLSAKIFGKTSHLIDIASRKASSPLSPEENHAAKPRQGQSQGGKQADQYPFESTVHIPILREPNPTGRSSPRLGPYRAPELDVFTGLILVGQDLLVEFLPLAHLMVVAVPAGPLADVLYEFAVNLLHVHFPVILGILALKAPMVRDIAVVARLLILIQKERLGGRFYLFIRISFKMQHKQLGRPFIHVPEATHPGIEMTTRAIGMTLCRARILPFPDRFFHLMAGDADILREITHGYFMKPEKHHQRYRDHNQKDAGF